MNKSNKFSPEVRERAQQQGQDAEAQRRRSRIWRGSSVR